MLSLYAVKDEDHPDGIWRIKTFVGGHYVGQVWPEEAAISEGVDAEAMAYLLAAAPTMLKALLYAWDVMDHEGCNSGDLAVIARAIVEAQGKGKG